MALFRISLPRRLTYQRPSDYAPLTLAARLSNVHMGQLASLCHQRAGRLGKMAVWNGDEADSLRPFPFAARCGMPAMSVLPGSTGSAIAQSLFNLATASHCADYGREKCEHHRAPCGP